MMMNPNNIDLRHVLCGKSKDCVNFPGSIRFREIIDSYASRYARASNKHEKMAVTREIYDKVTKENGSRFLKFNEDEQVWEEISMMAARDKIGHSLRFAGRAKRRGQKLPKRSESLSSASSAESEKATSVARESLRDSLVGNFQQGMIGAPSASGVPSDSLSPLDRLLTRMESEEYKICDNSDVAKGPDDLLTLLQQDMQGGQPGYASLNVPVQGDQSVSPRLNGFTADRNKNIDNTNVLPYMPVQAAKNQSDNGNGNVLSLMTEPLGD